MIIAAENVDEVFGEGFVTGEVSAMRATAIVVRCAHTDHHSERFGLTSGFERNRHFGQGGAEAVGLLDVPDGGIVVAAKRDGAMEGGLHFGPVVHLPRPPDPLLEPSFGFGQADVLHQSPAFHLLVIGVPILPLAGSGIIEDEVSETLAMRDQPLQRAFTWLETGIPADMDKVATERGLAETRVLFDQSDPVTGPRPQRPIGFRGDTRRAQHGGDTTTDGAKVHQVKREGQRKVGVWPRMDLFFEVIGVDIDHARSQVLSMKIDAFGVAAFGLYVFDPPLGNYDGAVDGAVGQYESGVAENMPGHVVVVVGEFNRRLRAWSEIRSIDETSRSEMIA